MNTYKCYNFSTWKVHMLGKKINHVQNPPRYTSSVWPWA